MLYVIVGPHQCQCAVLSKHYLAVVARWAGLVTFGWGNGVDDGGGGFVF